MSTISIQLPPIEAEHSVEVDVRVNGEQRLFRYRVEVFDLGPGVQRVDVLRRMIAAYDSRWQLMQIGAPTATSVPVMFRQVV